MLGKRMHTYREHTFTPSFKDGFLLTLEFKVIFYTSRGPILRIRDIFYGTKGVGTLEVFFALVQCNTLHPINTRKKGACPMVSIFVSWDKK